MVGLGFRDTTPRMENQMEKNMENTSRFTGIQVPKMEVIFLEPKP